MRKPVANTIGAAQLAALIGLDELLLPELANRGRLPFQVSSRGFAIHPNDLSVWINARKRFSHWLNEIPEA